MSGKQLVQARGGQKAPRRNSEIDRISDVFEHDERFIEAGEFRRDSGIYAQKTKQMWKQDNYEFQGKQSAMYERKLSQNDAYVVRITYDLNTIMVTM